MGKDARRSPGGGNSALRRESNPERAIVRLQNQAGEMQAEVDKLHERVDKNSQNSSKTPSSDPPQKRTYPKPEPSGEKKGGRKGHQGHGRKLKPAAEVSRIICTTNRLTC